MLSKSQRIILSIIASVILLSLGFRCCTIYAEIQIDDQDLKIELVATGLNSPTSMAFVGPDDILVLEKAGKVQRIIANESMGKTILDITPTVDSRKERGLLGIAISHDRIGKSSDEFDENDRSENSSDVFLFFTEKTNSSQLQNSCQSNICNSNDSAVSSVYKYNFKNNHLVDRTLIMKIPFERDDPAFEHIGGAITMGPDGNIYIPRGDGRPCYNYEHCKISINGGALDSQTANSKNGSVAIGNGGILFLPKNGDATQNRGPLGDQYPLNLYYAYGIRNSFGIDFDPVTGKLWDTENGPFYGDEINLVDPGFNSGWTKIQGVWPISNYSELIIDAPEGSPRGHPPQSNEFGNWQESMFDFDGNGKYSQPEFTWNKTVGVTSIKFYNSNKLGKEYENDVFVATFNQGGWIFHFDLDKDRRNLDLKRDLKDRVADNPDELQDVLFARGFGSITDLEVGPDGYLYVLSIGKGAIYKITPKLSN